MATNKKEKASYDAKLNQYFLSSDIEPYPRSTVFRTISEKIKKSKEDLENEDYEQDIKLKRKTLRNLFVFLTAETIAIFLFAYWQAIKYKGFHLDEWSFRLLVGATISQITFMLSVAVKHLFPGGRNKN